MSAEVLSGVSSAVGVAPSVAPAVAPAIGVPEAFTNAFAMPAVEPQAPEMFTKAFGSTQEVPQAFLDAFKEPEVPEAFTKAFQKPSEVEEPETLIFEAEVETVSPRFEKVHQEFSQIEIEEVSNAPKTELSPQIVEEVRSEVLLSQKTKELLLSTGVSEKEAVRVSKEALNEALLKKRLRLKQKQVKEEKVEFSTDENAQEARRKDAETAIEKTFEKDGPKTGAEVIENMSDNPKEEEISEIALKFGQKYDGSFTELVNEAKTYSFESKKDAKDKLNELIDKKPAVKKGQGKKVERKDIERVLFLKNFRNPIPDFFANLYERV